MEMAMIRANIDEDREATMARFLAGLDPDIANVVELQHNIGIDDMVHMEMKVEKQLKRKGAARPYASNTSKWRHGSNKKNVAIPTKDCSGSSKPKKPIIESNKGKNTSTPVRSRDVQCFKCLGRDHIASQCPNRNAMFIRENGEIEYDHEEEEETEVPIDEEEMEFAVDGEALVVKRSLSTQVMESEQQRENIFHMRCHVNAKDYEDLFPEDTPSGLPPIRGIEHQIDFIPGATIPNRPAYRSNPEETKESCSSFKVSSRSFEKKKLYSNVKKCTFCTEKLVFLGFVVSSEGLEVDQEKVKAIQEWPRPISITQVRSFHGLFLTLAPLPPH
ncbi:hypothetical protein GQ457_13G016280 [Hibiscus cannabinus]